jgi:CTP synthase
VLVELGGTVGDMENAVFYEALRQSILHAGRENIIFLFISYIPEFKSGEFKSKPC